MLRCVLPTESCGPIGARSQAACRRRPHGDVAAGGAATRSGELGRRSRRGHAHDARLEPARRHQDPARLLGVPEALRVA
eukprot:3137383-Prymnesium_polylepis.1